MLWVLISGTSNVYPHVFCWRNQKKIFKLKFFLFSLYAIRNAEYVVNQQIKTNRKEQIEKPVYKL